MSTYRYIAQRQGQLPVRQLCQVLRVSVSAYYAWQRRQLPAPESAWQVAVRAEFSWRVALYGTRRLRAELHAKGYPVGRWRIRRVLAAAGLRAQQPRAFVPRTTDSDPNVRAAPNLLLGQPAPSAPNQVWVGDITYLPKQGGGWLYLATWLDRYSRKIVGWDVRESMPKDLVSEALRRALAVRQPAAGLVVHSDQGSQYSATNFKALVARHKAVQSMSRRGNCYDNAHAESFWSRLKTELLAGGSFRNLAEAAAGNQPLSSLLQRRAPPFGPRLARPQPLRNPLSNHFPTLCGLARPPHIFNRNKFILDPSGSGKSFFTNHLVRQYPVAALGCPAHTPL